MKMRPNIRPDPQSRFATRRRGKQRTFEREEPMFVHKLFDALADLADDLRDARELRGAQLQHDARLAFSLFLSSVGQHCLEEGTRIRSWLMRMTLNRNGYFGGRVDFVSAYPEEMTSGYADKERKCGARGPIASCIFPEGHPPTIPHWDGVGTFPRGICPATHNSSDKGWFNCQREYGHPGKHCARDGVEWEPAPREQREDVISVAYDD